MRVEIICCGGTIDKIYFDAQSAYRVGKPTAPEVLRRARVPGNRAVKSVLREDSLDMTAADRKLVAAAVRKSNAKRILITHGTDTMAQTARVVEEAINERPKQEKTVVFTGSYSPAIFRDTDADFNIGFALAAAQLLPPGVYVAISGKVFPAENVRKNIKTGEFENI